MIAITAPTGNVGSRVARLVFQAGAEMRLLCRDASKLDVELQAFADVREGDLLDGDYLRDATDGAAAMFWLVPEDFSAQDPHAVTEQMGANAASAVAENGIGRVVMQSSVGAEKRGGAGLIDGLARNEEQLGEVAADLTILRCGYFFTNLLPNAESLAQGSLPTTMDLDQPLPWVNPRDIGEVAAARLLDAGWSGHHVQAVHGPEDLTVTQVAEILSGALGRPIEAQRISDDDLLAELEASGMFSDAAAEGLVQMTVGTRDGFEPEQSRSLLSTTPSTLGAWAYANLRPLLS